jgi:hypothetical protein
MIAVDSVGWGLAERESGFSRAGEAAERRSLRCEFLKGHFEDGANEMAGAAGRSGVGRSCAEGHLGRVRQG